VQSWGIDWALWTFYRENQTTTKIKCRDWCIAHPNFSAIWHAKLVARHNFEASNHIKISGRGFAIDPTVGVYCALPDSRAGGEGAGCPIHQEPTPTSAFRASPSPSSPLQSLWIRRCETFRFNTPGANITLTIDQSRYISRSSLRQKATASRRRTPDESKPTFLH